MIGHGGAPTMRPWGIRDQLDGVHNLAALFADPKAFAKNLADYEALLRKNEEAEKKARQAEAALKTAKAQHDKREQRLPREKRPSRRVKTNWPRSGRNWSMTKPRMPVMCKRSMPPRLNTIVRMESSRARLRTSPAGNNRCTMNSGR